MMGTASTPQSVKMLVGQRVNVPSVAKRPPPCEKSQLLFLFFPGVSRSGANSTLFLLYHFDICIYSVESVAGKEEEEMRIP